MSTGPPGSARARLLAAADELFGTRGVDATGPEALLAAAGLTRADFEREFAGKDELVTAYLTERERRSRAALEAAVTAAGEDPRPRLLACFDALLAEAGYPFATAAAWLPADHPAEPLVAAHRETVRARIAELADAAPHTAPHLLLDQLVLLLVGAAQTAALGTVEHPAQKARMIAAQLIYAG